VATAAVLVAAPHKLDQPLRNERLEEVVLKFSVVDPSGVVVFPSHDLLEPVVDASLHSGTAALHGSFEAAGEVVVASVVVAAEEPQGGVVLLPTVHV
jgi:hypothetical protein